MEKQWFVIHTLTGQEMKVRESVSRRLQLEEMEDYVEEVIIPTETVQEVKKGVKSTMTRKFFPGYVLIKIALYNEERELMERSWRFIKETTGVIGFVGGERPVPLRPAEVDDILNQVEEKQEKVSPKISFTEGEVVKINDGPFVSHTGPIKMIDPDRGKLTVLVSVFGREVPVELEYWQVERA